MKYAAYQEGELVESIELLHPTDLLDQEGRVREYGEELDRFYSGPGRPFGAVYEVLKMADDASPEEFEEAEQAMKILNKRLDGYRRSVDPYYDEEDPSFQNFELARLDDGVYIVVTEGSYDI